LISRTTAFPDATSLPLPTYISFPTITVHNRLFYRFHSPHSDCCSTVSCCSFLPFDSDSFTLPLHCRLMHGYRYHLPLRYYRFSVHTLPVLLPCILFTLPFAGSFRAFLFRFHSRSRRLLHLDYIYTTITHYVLYFIHLTFPTVDGLLTIPVLHLFYHIRPYDHCDVVLIRPTPRLHHKYIVRPTYPVRCYLPEPTTLQPVFLFPIVLTTTNPTILLFISSTITVVLHYICGPHRSRCPFRALPTIYCYDVLLHSTILHSIVGYITSVTNFYHYHSKPCLFILIR